MNFDCLDRPTAANSRARACRAGHTASTPRLAYHVVEPRSGKCPRHTVVLSHALGCDRGMWESLADELAGEHRVLTYDHRGHGRSDAPPGEYRMAELADDAARLLRELDSGPVVWVGLSIGGMVGQELALRHPALIAGLVLANTTSGYSDALRALWRARIDLVRVEGIGAIADAVITRYFHAQFRENYPALVAGFRVRLLATDLTGYIGCCAAVSGVNTSARLTGIDVPTLVIAGALDENTPVTMARTLADGIEGARLLVLTRASHLSAIEQPDAFEVAVMDFLSSL